MLLHSRLAEVVEHVADCGDLFGVSVDGFETVRFGSLDVSAVPAGKLKPVANTVLIIAT
jgi:hypothetical protein